MRGGSISLPTGVGVARTAYGSSSPEDLQGGYSCTTFTRVSLKCRSKV